MDAPEVVDENVKDTEHNDKEHAGPLGLEANGDHSAGAKTDEGDQHACEAPLSAEGEAYEEENEEDTACQ